MGKVITFNPNQRKIYSGEARSATQHGFSGIPTVTKTLTDEDKKKIRDEYNPNLSEWEKYLNENRQQYKDDLNTYNSQLKYNMGLSYETKDSARYNALLSVSGKKQDNVPASKSELVTTYEDTQKQYNSQNIIVNDNGLIELTDAQIEQVAAMNRGNATKSYLTEEQIIELHKIQGTYDPTIDYSQEMTPEEQMLKDQEEYYNDMMRYDEVTRDKIMMLSDQTSYQSMKQLEKNIKSGMYWDADYGFADDRLSNDIEKYNLQNNQVAITEVYEAALEYNLDRLDSEWGANTGNSMLDFIAKTGSETIMNYWSLANAVEYENLDRFWRAKDNTDAAKKITQAMYGDAEEAAKIAKETNYNLSEFEQLNVDLQAFQESIGNKSYMTQDYVTGANASKSFDYWGGFIDQLGQQASQISDPWTFFLTAVGALGGGLVGGISTGGAGTGAGIKTGAKLGLTLGNSKAALEVEAGFAFKEMIDSGIDPEIAKSVALHVGGLNAAIEFAEFSSLTKWVNSSGGDQALKFGVKEWLKETAKSVGTNVAQEIVQETVTISGYNIAVNKHNLEYDDSIATISFNDAVDRLIETGKSSLFTFTLMQTPNMIVSAQQMSKFNFNDTQKQQWTDEVMTAIDSTNNPIEANEIMKSAINLMDRVGINDTQAQVISQRFDNKIASFDKQTVEKLQNTSDTVSPQQYIKDTNAKKIIEVEQTVLDIKKIPKSELDKSKENTINNIVEAARETNPEKITANYNVDKRFPRIIKYDKKEVPIAIDTYKNQKLPNAQNVYNNSEIKDIINTKQYSEKTNRAVAVGSMLADVFGIDIIYHDTPVTTDNKYARTEALPNAGFVSINLNEIEQGKFIVPAENIIGHELFHIVASKNPRVANDIMQIVADNVSKGDIGIFELLYNYKKTDKIPSQITDRTIEELSADLFAKVISSDGSTILNKIVGKNKTLATQLIDLLKEISDIIKKASQKLIGRTSHIANEKQILLKISDRLNKSIVSLTKDMNLKTDEVKKVNSVFERVHKTTKKTVEVNTTVMDDKNTVGTLPGLPELTRHNYRKEIRSFSDSVIEDVKYSKISPAIAITQLQNIASNYVNSDIGIEVLAMVSDTIMTIHEISVAYNIDTEDAFKQMFVSMGLTAEEIKAIMMEKQRKTIERKQALEQEKTRVYKPMTAAEKAEQARQRTLEYQKAIKEGRVTKLDSRGKVIQKAKQKVRKNLEVLLDGDVESTKTITNKNKKIIKTQYTYDSNPLKTKKLEATINRKDKELSILNERVSREKARASALRVKLAEAQRSQSKSKINNLKRANTQTNQRIRDIQKEMNVVERENKKLKKQFEETKHMTEVSGGVIADVDLNITNDDLAVRRFVTNTAQKNEILKEANTIVPMTEKTRSKYTTQLVLDKAKQIKKKYTEQQISDHLISITRALNPVEQALLYDQLTEARNVNDVSKSQVLMQRLMRSSSEAGLSLWFNREMKSMLPEFIVQRTVDRITARVEDLKKSKNKQLSLWAENFDLESPKGKAILDNVRMYAEAVTKIKKEDVTSSARAEKIFAELKRVVDLNIPVDTNETFVAGGKVSGMLTFGIAKLARDVSSNALNMGSQAYEAMWSGGLGAKIAEKVTGKKANEYTVNPLKMYKEYAHGLVSGIKTIPAIIAYEKKRVKEAKRQGGNSFAAKVVPLAVSDMSHRLANIIDSSSQAAILRSVDNSKISKDDFKKITNNMHDLTVMNLRGNLYRAVVDMKNKLNNASETATANKLHLGNYFLPVLKYGANAFTAFLRRNSLSVLIYDAKTIAQIRDLKKAMNDPNVPAHAIEKMKTDTNTMIQTAIGRTGVSATLTILAAMLASALKSDDEETKEIANTINEIISSRWLESVDLLTLNATTELLTTDSDGVLEYIDNYVGTMGNLFIENTVFNTFLYPTRYTMGYEEAAQGYVTNVLSTMLTSQIPSFVSEISDLVAFITNQPAKDVYGGDNIIESSWYRLLDRSGIGNFWGIPVVTTKYGDITNNIVNDELTTLYAQTDENMFTKPSRSFVLSSQDYKFNNEQYDEFTERLGELNGDDIVELVSSQRYDEMTDAERLEAIKQINSTNVKYARLEIIKEYEIKPV